MKTEHIAPDAAHTHIFLAVRFVAQLFDISRFFQCTCIGSRLESSQHVCRVLHTVRVLHSHFSISCLVALPERRSTVPDGLETVSGIHCNDPGGGVWFGRMAEQSQLTQIVKSVMGTK